MSTIKSVHNATFLYQVGLHVTLTLALVCTAMTAAAPSGRMYAKVQDRQQWQDQSDVSLRPVFIFPVFVKPPSSDDSFRMVSTRVNVSLRKLFAV